MAKSILFACVILVFSSSPAMACLNGGGISIKLPNGTNVEIKDQSDTEVHGYKIVFQKDGWKVTIIDAAGAVYQSKILGVAKGGCGLTQTSIPVPVTGQRY